MSRSQKENLTCPNFRTGTICDSRIRVIHQENHGLGHARNTGMRLATGKYIIFLDSDDYWRSDALEGLIIEAEENDLQVVALAISSRYIVYIEKQSK